mgnify:CR=1 FL=1
MENTTRSTAVVVDRVSTKTLHPLYAHFDGQTSPQDAYVELDLDSGNLSADYSPAYPWVPIRVFEGDVVRFDVDPHLTASEINALLDEIAPVAQEWIDARQGDELDSDTISYVIDAGFKIQQLCEGRVTESGGVWDAGDWAISLTPDDIGLRHDSTDADLDEIAKTLRGIAEDDGPITLVSLDEYLIDQREILRANMQED